jgi:hypothetical protein
MRRTRSLGAVALAASVVILATGRHAVAQRADDATPSSDPTPPTAEAVDPPEATPPAKPTPDPPEATPPAAAPEAAGATPADGSAQPAQTGFEPTPASDLLSMEGLRRRLAAIQGRAAQTRARVGLLKAVVLRGGPSSVATIVHQSDMGDQFRLIRIAVSLDGTRVYSQFDDTGALAEQRTLNILSGPIEPGNHTLTVALEYRGHGYGPFRFLNNQNFAAEGSRSFEVKPGEVIRLTSIAYERKDAALEDKAAVKFSVNKNTN